MHTSTDPTTIAKTRIW